MYRKLMQVLRDDEVKFCTAFMPDNVYGINEGGCITINLIHCLTPTITHEILHELYPECTEREILALEKVVYNRLTFTQRRNVYKLFLKRVIQNEKEKKHAKEDRTVYQKRP